MFEYLDEVFRAYDIRGKYPEQINKEFAERLGKSYAMLGYKEIVVGRDNRPGSEKLQNALVKGIIESGVNVIDVGIGSTDFIFYAPRVLNKELSINITASHLLPDKNGFKSAFRQGNSFLPEDWNKLKEIFRDGNFKTGKGKVEKAEIKSRYKEKIKEIAKKYSQNFKIKAVVDNAKGTALTAELLRELGSEVIEIFPERNPEPKEDTLQELSKAVIAHKADIGIAHDIDADRFVAVDSRGRIIKPDTMMHILVDAMIKQNETVIGTIDISQSLKEKVESKGSRYIISRVGDSFISDLVHKENSILAFEASYHFYTSQFIDYSSGPLFALVFAGIAKSLANKVDNAPKLFVTRKKVNADNKFEKMKHITSEIKQKYEIISDIDGIKFKIDSGTCLIRPSNTEDIIRFTAETDEQKKSDEITNELMKELL